MNNSINHKFHHISRAEYQELLAVSRGDAVADYIIDNVSILDLINGGEISGPIVIKGRYIAGVGAEYTDAPALQRIDARGATAVPGFIDAHLHIESSMMTPVTFETATLPRGLTTAYPPWKAAMLTVPVLPLNRCSPGGTIRRLPALQK